MLDDPDYNMRLGAGFLGDLVSDFDGSYIMAAAAYNAGPSRPPQWVAACGDPRSAATDPVDYIECIPIGETRNYVMRVLENAQVYRARLNGGRAPLTLMADLKRGAYGQAAPPYQLAQNTAAPPLVVSQTDAPLRAAAAPPEAAAPDGATFEHPVLERGVLRHVKTQAQIMNGGKVHKIKARGARHGKTRRKKS
jgi:hypothetical protein